MRIDSPEYLLWKKKQNAKNLKRRTKRKKHQINHLQSQSNYNHIVKETPEYNMKDKRFDFCAPINFSIADNPDETTSFFNRIISFITDRRNFGKRLFIDISKIQWLKSDALMYLLAIVNNLNEKYKGKYTFSGNAPQDKGVFLRFLESGFYNYVKCSTRLQHIASNDNIQIVTGTNCDTTLAKKISDFVSEKASVGISECKFLYNTMIELMSNTHKHAYHENDVLVPQWYCFAEYDSQQKLSFTFMDTGCGIPTTVQKNFAERIDVLGLKSENKYVISALDGDFRTATKQGYRGKGLPKVREYCSMGVIRNLHIVSSKAVVNVHPVGYDGKDLSVPMRGTLYCWEIDVSALKGVKNEN